MASDGITRGRVKLDTKDVLRIVIEAVELFAPTGAVIQPESMLLEDELIDSMNILQIVVELESRLEMSIGPLDISFEDFATPQRLADAVVALQGR
jgi:acyl carrier protein